MAGGALAIGSGFCVAERAGFEPAIRGYRIPLFESGAFSHSATSPKTALEPANEYISALLEFRCELIADIRLRARGNYARNGLNHRRYR